MNNTSTQSFRRVLSHPNFFRLWMGQIVSSVGDRFYQFAILYVVLKLSPAAGVGVGKESARVLFCGMILNLILFPWIGRIIDHFSRRNVMIFSDLIRVFLVFGMLVVWLNYHSMPLMFLLIALMGLMNSVFIPARQAAVPQLVPPNQLMTANALVTIIGVVASLFGAAAGFIVAIFGEKSSFIITALGFLFSGYMIWRIDSPLRPKEASIPVNGFKDIAHTLRTVFHDHLVRLLFLLSGGSQFITGLFLIFVLEHSVRNFDLSSLEYVVQLFGHLTTSLGFKEPIVEIRLLALVILLFCTGLGLVLGVFISGKVPRFSHYEGLPLLMFICLGISFLGFAQISDFLAAAALAVILGAVEAFLTIPIEARLQACIPDKNHGRIFAARSAWTCFCFLLALGLNLDGRLLEWRGPELMIRDLGLACVVFGTLLCTFHRRLLTKFWFPTNG